MATTLEELELRVSVLEKNDSQMMVKLTKITENTDFMVEILDNSRAAFKLIRWIGKIITWAGGVAVAMTAIWAIWVTYRTGQIPTHR